MAATLFTVLLFLIHSFVIICEKTYDLAQSIVNFVVVYVFYSLRILDNNFQYENDYIEYNVRKLEKMPKHLVVMLGTEIPNIDSLAKLIFWSWSAGISAVSFFDHKGEFYEECN
jgi:hypothetical protein